MKHRNWLLTVLFVITNMVSPIHLTLVTDATEFQHPTFTECKENRYCKKHMEASGSFSCVIRDVNPDVRLTVITNSTELNIYFQKESIITTDGVSNVTLQSNFTTSESGLSKCNGELMVTCKAMDRGPPNIQIGSTARLGILIACEKTLSIEEKVWLAAITLFPLLWVFTLVIVCCMNKKNLFNICRHDWDYSKYDSEKLKSPPGSMRLMSLTIRPRLVKDIDGEPNDKSITYVYFTDDRSCYAVPVKTPHKSIKLVLEKKTSRKNEQAASKLESPSVMEEEDIELSVLEPMQDSSVHDCLVEDSSVQDASTPEKTDIQQESSVITDTSMVDSVTELDRKASTSSKETLHESLEWCRCGKCQELPEKSKVCCRRTYGECVTDDPLFYQLVTDRNTLQAAMIQWNDDQVASRFEAMAYKEYIFWQMGVTQNYNKVIIPPCVVKKVQSRYRKDSYGNLQRFLSLKI